MANKISKLMAFLTHGDGATHPAYTCPSGRKALITHIHLANNGSVMQPAILEVYDGTTAAATICYNIPILPNDPGVDFYSTPGYVIPAGYQLRQTLGNTTSLLVSGYEEIIE